MEVIEKEKVYLREDEGQKKNYATKGEALGIGIPALVLGGLAFLGQNGNGFGLFGNKSNAGTTPMSQGGCTLTCQDKIELTSAFYQGRITQLNERFEDRNVIDRELFGLYKSQIDADFNLYKGQRDQFDVLKGEIDNLKCHIAVTDAVAPYKDKILNDRICLEAERRSCADEKIVQYANSTFYPVEIADVTVGTTSTPKQVYDPLCPCRNNGCGW